MYALGVAGMVRFYSSSGPPDRDVAPLHVGYVIQSSVMCCIIAFDVSWVRSTEPCHMKHRALRLGGAETEWMIFFVPRLSDAFFYDVQVASSQERL